MAETAPTGGEGDAKGSTGGKFPGPVSCYEDDPKKGFFTIHLSVPELETNKQFGVFGKKAAKNGEVKVSFDSGSIAVIVDVTPSSGESISYEYKRDLPAEIEPESSDHKIKSKGLQLTLCKADKKESWSPYVKHFIKKNP